MKLGKRLGIPTPKKAALEKVTPKRRRQPDIPQRDTQPCYPWENNSCWLDASLQLLFAALSHNFSEFSSLVQTIQPEHPLRMLHDIFQQRLTLKLLDSTMLQILKRQRNDLREQILKHGLASHPTSFEPLMVSLSLSCLTNWQLVSISMY